MRAWLTLTCLWAAPAMAGLLPEEVIVLGAEQPPESAALAQRYQALRGLPSDSVCLLPGAFPEVLPQEEYNRFFWPRVSDCLAGRSIGAIVTVKGLPVRVGGYSLEALLALGDSQGPSGLLREQVQQGRAWLLNPFYGRSPYDGLPPFRRGELPRGFRPGDGAPYGLDFRFATRLDGFTFADAEALVTRSIESDGAGVDGDWLCMAGADAARGVRDSECSAMLDLIDELDWARTKSLDFDPQLAGEHLAGYFTGSANLHTAIAGNSYPPGAIADNITSLMGVPGNFGTGQSCSEDSDCDAAGGQRCVESVCLREAQTSVARLIAAGVTGAHATAAEPYNNTFPSALVIALYLQGYSLAESFYFAMPFLGWVNVVYGDPLTAPFARHARPDVGEEVTLDPVTPLRLEFTLPDRWRVAGIDVFHGRDHLWSEDFGRDEINPLWVWDHGLSPGRHQLTLRIRSEPMAQELGASFSAAHLWPEPRVMSQRQLTLTIQQEAIEPEEPREIHPPEAGCSCRGASPLSWSLLLVLGACRIRRRR